MGYELIRYLKKDGGLLRKALTRIRVTRTAFFGRELLAVTLTGVWQMACVGLNVGIDRKPLRLHRESLRIIKKSGSNYIPWELIENLRRHRESLVVFRDLPMDSQGTF